MSFISPCQVLRKHQVTRNPYRPAPEKLLGELRIRNTTPPLQQREDKGEATEIRQCTIKRPNSEAGCSLHYTDTHTPHCNNSPVGQAQTANFPIRSREPAHAQGTMESILSRQMRRNRLSS